MIDMVVSIKHREMKYDDEVEVFSREYNAMMKQAIKEKWSTVKTLLEEQKFIEWGLHILNKFKGQIELYEDEKVKEQNIICPNCGNKRKIPSVIYYDEEEKKIFFVCVNCGFSEEI